MTNAEIQSADEHVRAGTLSFADYANEMRERRRIDIKAPTWSEVYTPLVVSCVLVVCIGVLGFAAVLGVTEMQRLERQLAVEARR